MSLDPKVRETSPHSGTRVQKVCCPLVYSMFVIISVAWGSFLCVFVIFLWLCFALSFPVPAWRERRQMVDDTADWAGGRCHGPIICFPLSSDSFTFNSFFSGSSLSSSLPFSSFSSLTSCSYLLLRSSPSIYLLLSLMNISYSNAIYRCDIIPLLHPSSSAFSSARIIQWLPDWALVSCHS